MRLWLILAAVLIGGVAQAASLQDLQGNPHALDEYTGKGKWTVVMLWASDCHVCNMEAEQYIQFHETHKNNDAEVLGISLDGQQRLDEARAFMQRHDVTFPSLIGEPRAVAQMFSRMTGSPWRGTPTFMVFNPQGELLAAQPGAVPTHLIEEFIRQQSASSPKAAQEAPAPSAGDS